VRQRRLDVEFSSAKNNAARYDTGGVAELKLGVALERPIAQVQCIVVRGFVQRLVKAINLLAITSLKTIKQLVDKVVKLNDSLITEPGQSDSGALIVPIVVAGVGIRFIHCSSPMAC
jgi:hypothetical protein